MSDEGRRVLRGLGKHFYDFYEQLRSGEEGERTNSDPNLSKQRDEMPFAVTNLFSRFRLGFLSIIFREHDSFVSIYWPEARSTVQRYF